MAQNDLEEEKESSGGFARFMFFVTPILFTIVLLGVLLTLLNMNIRKEALSLLNQIPIVKQWVPDPEESSTADGKAKTQEKSSEATIKELKSKVAEQEDQLKKANEAATQQKTQVQDLQSQLDEAKTVEEEKAEEKAAEADEAYQKQVKK